MRSSELVAELRSQGLDVEVRGEEAELVDLTHDSSQAGAGVGFAAVAGQRRDGHDFAAEAVAAGSPVLLVERYLPLEITQLLVPDVRRAMGPAAAAIHGHPDRELSLVGVTGTNGKTSVVHLVAEICRRVGTRVAVSGTLTGTRTTPEATDLIRWLAQRRQAGDQVVAMEVSSHALVLDRVEGLTFAAVAFTNLSPEHLDFHGSMKDYLAAKALLFSDERAPVGLVVADDEWGREMLERATIAVRALHRHQVEPVRVGPAGIEMSWRGRTVVSPLTGDIMVPNLLVAAELAVELGLDVDEVAEAMGHASGPPGRFEAIRAGQPFEVVVDYAHTPDALKVTLGSARGLCRGQLVVVFGCGGDRDRGKRPLMGDVASRLADRVIITSDNPRSEDPVRIMNEIAIAAPRAELEPDRATAIARALEGAGPGDVVVVAGKGHETTQEIDGRFEPFDDRELVRSLLEEGR